VSATLVDLAEGYTGEAFVSTPKCPICNGASSVAHDALNVHPDKAYRFGYRVCDRCSHGWIDPMPSQELLNHLYSNASSSVIGSGWTDIKSPRLTVPEQLVLDREMTPERGAKQYFELGVGKGLLYRQFLKAGWLCRGVEPGAWGRDLCGVESHLNYIPNSLSAELVVALDVLEHIADPISTLRQLRNLAADGARLYCAMPNRQSLRATIGRSRWRMLRPLGHVNYWSRESVMEAFAKSRFTIEELIKTDLWEPRPIRTLREAAAAAIEHLGLGDQWIAIARAT
jgi:hypothetical protein